MELEQVVTASDFITFVRDLSRQAAQYLGSLEEYLRCVLSVAIAHQEEPPTWRLLAQVLADGLTAPPQPFDLAWLGNTEPPELVWQRPLVSADGFASAQSMLHYQIANLHRMAENGTINDPFRYGGIDSPTSHSWYNFDPETFIECSSSGMEDNHGIGTAEGSWEAFTIILWLGQIYE